jgi:MtN3 and saliva related transmembrane protein
MLENLLAMMMKALCTYQSWFKIRTLDDVIGHIATILSAAALLPQIFRIWKTRSAKDISIGMCFLLLMASSIQCVYGYLIGALPIIMTNAISIVLRTWVLVFKIYMDAQNKQEPSGPQVS